MCPLRITTQPQASRNREPRGIQAHVAVPTIFVDFAIDAIETGAAERAVEYIAQNSRLNEAVVLETSQAVGDRRNAISRDGVVDHNIFFLFSCLKQS
jgi:hypothetical protein